MADSQYIIRSYHSSDCDDYVKLNLEAEQPDITGRHLSPQIIIDSLYRPNYSPEHNLFVAEVNREIIGFIDITPELKKQRVLLYCLIHPDHRGKELAGKLLNYATGRARKLQAKILRVNNVRQDNEVARRVLPRLGFRCAHCYLELRLPLADIGLPDAVKSNYSYRHLRSGDEYNLTRLQNRCFADAWEYHPNTTEDVVYAVTRSHCSPAGIILVYGGDKPIGYCWTRTKHGAEAGGSLEKGCIRMLGVDPDYQGQGIGRAALLAGLTYLKNKGTPTVELEVDSENKTALALYHSIGFTEWTRNYYYEKPID